MLLLINGAILRLAVLCVSNQVIAPVPRRNAVPLGFKWGGHQATQSWCANLLQEGANDGWVAVEMHTVYEGCEMLTAALVKELFTGHEYDFNERVINERVLCLIDLLESMPVVMCHSNVRN